VLSAIYSGGEAENIMKGVFENYLNAKFSDTTFENVVKGGEWFTQFDILHKEMIHSHNYSVMPYLNYPIVAAHFLFSSTNSIKLLFPTQLTENRNKETLNKNILDSVRGEMRPSIRTFCSRGTLVKDLLPNLLSVIQPLLRPVNTQLYSAKEKAELANLVDIHIAYNLTYVQERNVEGQYEYKMDPDVENVVRFPGVERIVQLSYGLKLLISHEIELEKMRREDVRNVAAPVVDRKPSVAPSQPATDSQTSDTKATPAYLSKLTPKQIVIKERKPTDFFGRVIQISEEKKGHDQTNDIIKTDVWFKFKEGYSNAVRRNVKMKDLL